MDFHFFPFSRETGKNLFQTKTLLQPKPHTTTVTITPAAAVILEIS